MVSPVDRTSRDEAVMKAFGKGEHETSHSQDAWPDWDIGTNQDEYAEQRQIPEGCYNPRAPKFWRREDGYICQVEKSTGSPSLVNPLLNEEQLGGEEQEYHIQEPEESMMNSYVRRKSVRKFNGKKFTMQVMRKNVEDLSEVRVE
ncbi:unnamed protein product [Ilex paraguariensis]|uniref:Uncharacterized protein n=1 Tax=Ilex paraguariensis TaxID=185542 RepID=A0ABC8TDA9_9AQUA